MDNKSTLPYFSIDVGETSLYGFLHDSVIESISWDEAANTVRLIFDCYSVRRHHRFADDLRFGLLFSGVSSVLGLLFLGETGGLIVLNELPAEPYRQLYEHHCLTRNWRAVASQEIFDEINSFEAQGSNGSYSQEHGFVFADLGIGAYAADFRAYNIYIRALNLSVFRSDGELISLEQLEAFSEAYWDDFRNK